MDTELENLIAAWLDGRISEKDSQTLQTRLRDSAEARALFRQYTRMDAAMRELASGDPVPQSVSSETLTDGSANPVTLERQYPSLRTWTQLACAAALLMIVGGVAYRLGRSDAPRSEGTIAVVDSTSDLDDERTIAGYATLRRVAGVKWSKGANAYREGDVLPAGSLEFDDGVAEIDFFCGATLVVEGPAKMVLESDWSVQFLAGRMRANVPPAARGFIVKAADSEIIDLGTEFALEVSPDNVRVEVVDGEVALRGGQHDGQHLVTGQGQSLLGADAGPDSLKGLSTVGDLRRRHEAEQRHRFSQWKDHSSQLRNDDRLVAYYPIAEFSDERYVPDKTGPDRERDGAVVGLVSRGHGRFGSESNSLGFYRPGSRVRVRIDGEFEAFTFACWVKIDSLEHSYNALFMGDGYENGEPHWQIDEDGRLMLSIMVDDTPGSGRGRPDARFHHIYYTEPMWDVSMSGQWLHIVSVYDPFERQVRQYVNGNEISREAIAPKFHVKTLRIGPAEIGNWGQPLRKSPWFAVRNLNGAIDELAIFNAALTASEILDLYEKGKPFGY